jgi:hypothetical protein
MQIKYTTKLLTFTGIIAILAAVWHLLCILGGVNWFAFARAPAIIIQSAQQGTWLAPVATIIVAMLMATCGLYAFSGAGRIRKLPLLKTAMVIIATLSLIRAILALPNLFFNEVLDLWQLIASAVWLFVGVSFLFSAIELFSTKIENE